MESPGVKLRKLNILSQAMRLRGSLELQSDLITLIQEGWSGFRLRSQLEAPSADGTE